ncbi:hypothetical protein GMB51_09270 [Turicibacter sanguinis]|nr:hypothetical protein [Turicibacter sanguinis]MTN51359.1 hypothetical protein [Turicibacter sanguinis]MTN54438.1 hypothetical protein [Turicibacter sanguinis]MTN57573.1 hypothetical protein [Turicibacter sanguinis]MTN60636.1 hypothetical protein [Turicibacter sanguinis]
MKMFNPRNILSSVISVTLVGWIFNYFGYRLGVLVCLSVALILWLVAGGLEKIAKVMRAATEQLQKK